MSKKKRPRKAPKKKRAASPATPPLEKKRPPEKGSVEFIPAPTEAALFEGVDIGVMYVGPKKIRRFLFAFSALQKSVVVEENQEERVKLFEELDALMEMTVTGLRGVPGIKQDDKEAALEYLEAWPMLEYGPLFNLLLSMQMPSRRSSFRAENARDHGPKEGSNPPGP